MSGSNFCKSIFDENIYDFKVMVVWGFYWDLATLNKVGPNLSYGSLDGSSFK